MEKMKEGKLFKQINDRFDLFKSIIGKNSNRKIYCLGNIYNFLFDRIYVGKFSRNVLFGFYIISY